MKHHRVAPIVDSQFTSEPFSRFGPVIEFSSLSLCIRHLVLRSRSGEVPRKVDRQLRYGIGARTGLSGNQTAIYHLFLAF
jgi:hypothetical protein